MKILVAPDKFKGTLDAMQAATIIAEGFAESCPRARYRLLPVADGGEGSMEVLLTALNGTSQEVDAHDALMRPIQARLGWIRASRLAVIEMSEASGLSRIAAEDRDPWRSNTYGTGQLLAAALALRPQRIIMGLGGSATNDAGLGMATALGWKFSPLRTASHQIAPCDFAGISRIHPPDPWPIRTEIIAACDVGSPLLGPSGASCVFGPQKGASGEVVRHLDRALRHVADLVAAQVGCDHRDVAGAGAAGGLGYGLLTFCQARLQSGFGLIAGLIGLEEAVADADLIITGEGSLDAQTLQGKAPAGVAALARRYHKPVWAMAGRITGEFHGLFDRCFAAAGPSVPDAVALPEAAGRLRERAREAGALWKTAAPCREWRTGAGASGA